MKKIIIILSIITITILSLVGCNKEEQTKILLNEYTKALNQGNYELVYENISKDSKANISKDNFV